MPESHIDHVTLKLKCRGHMTLSSGDHRVKQGVHKHGPFTCNVTWTSVDEYIKVRKSTRMH